jgi:hypothetical protein
MRFPPPTAGIAAISRQSRPFTPPHHPTAAQSRRICGYGATFWADFPYGCVFAPLQRLKKIPVAPLSERVKAGYADCEPDGGVKWPEYGSSPHPA